MKQIILILIVLALAVGGTHWLNTNKPEITKHSKKPNIPVVSVVQATKQDYPVTVHSSGIVQAHTQTNLVAEVAGKIVKIGKVFQEGNYLKKGDLLLKINETDYTNNISIANAEIALQQLALAEQKAQRDLAKQDWNLFGEKRKKPSDLAMRKPHIASAQAALQAAKTRMEQAKIQLARTKIRAPYNGRVLERLVDVGQYVTPGTILGKIFATDYIEVRLPLSLQEFASLDIPEHYQNETKPKTTNLPEVIFYSDKIHKDQLHWRGKIVRTSAEMDTTTRQLSVIARISKPFSKSNLNNPVIKLGQFLQADIKGKILPNVFVVPAAAIREHKDILLFIKNPDSKDETKTLVTQQKHEILGKVRILPVTILHTDQDHVIISADQLPANSLIISTPPPVATDGMKVKIISPEPTQTKER